MKRCDSFSAGMFVTFGVLAAFTLAGVAAYYALPAVVNAPTHKANAEDATLTAQAKTMAMPQLRRCGITALSDDSAVTRDDGDTVLVGTGLDKDGKLKNLMVRFQVARFGSKVQWKIKAIQIEANEVYRAKD